MPDLLVRLYDLPAPPPSPRLGAEGIAIRRAIPPERHVVTAWMARTFATPSWISECETAFSSLPVTAFIATRGGAPLGFACHDATARGFFGPTAVAEPERGKGIGEALLFATLRAMLEAGYAYAIIGGVGPVDFYRRHLDVLVIPGSDPGIYRGMLRA
ncbi:MAG: GNAT family N-acetyltransferase [Rhizobiales bacterium]|nr:GNAT family N-acetyltransferase [Hyphomicrobiales bacterium]